MAAGALPFNAASRTERACLGVGARCPRLGGRGDEGRELLAHLGSRKGSQARRRTYRLARSAAEITGVEVVAAVDGPLPAETPKISAEGAALDWRRQDVCEESAAVVRSIREGVRLAELTAEKPTTKKESTAEGWRGVIPAPQAYGR
jgi:hypothetical protein